MLHLNKHELAVRPPELLHEHEEYFAVNPLIELTREEAEAIFHAELINDSIPDELDDKLHSKLKGYTAGHGHSVAVIAQLINRELNYPIEPLKIAIAAYYHDIEKMKPYWSAVRENAGVPTDEQWENIIKPHARRGAKSLFNLWQNHHQPFTELGLDIHDMKQMCDYIFAHHERMDGNGYEKMPGDKIPMGAHIIRVADTYEVMNRGSRKYQKDDPALYKPRSPEVIFNELLRCSNQNWDHGVITGLEPVQEFHPDAVNALFQALPKHEEAEMQRIILVTNRALLEQAMREGQIH